ncbi:unnamed protein product [Merluccius merluccius]
MRLGEPLNTRAAVAQSRAGPPKNPSEPRKLRGPSRCGTWTGRATPHSPQPGGGRAAAAAAACCVTAGSASDTPSSSSSTPPGSNRLLRLCCASLQMPNDT